MSQELKQGEASLSPSPTGAVDEKGEGSGKGKETHCSKSSESMSPAES